MRRLTRGGFITCLAALFHPDGRVDLANVGHPPPYQRGQQVECPAGLPLGLAPDADYEETTVAIESLTCVSDGVVEAANATGELFGFDRTAAVSGKIAVAKEIAEAARAWGQTDDITVVTVQARTGSIT